MTCTNPVLQSFFCLKQRLEGKYQNVFQWISENIRHIQDSWNQIQMFFLPAELAKEAGNEVLSHWIGNLGMRQDVSFMLGDESQFSFLAGQCNRMFPPSHPLVSCCLEFILEVCWHVFPVVFPPFLSTLTLWCWYNCQLSAVALSCGRQKCIQCVRRVQFYTCKLSWLFSLTTSYFCTSQILHSIV